ncbi:hypothetical protein B0T25DRAFT_565642 [Lasiosphaeria hispida]|uniref:Uncharacterized protein n=1 Tax=Lasiosphaeria hispida TaxID=260671 RepID=A0AAJ0HSQ3_9PEZI|nr:hypothetical protein B0T25DRAFT_565642 [Lasiosphaeria hispida]
MATLRSFFSRHPRLWRLHSKTVEGMKVDGAGIAAVDQVFLDWLRLASLSPYTTEMLQTHNVHSFWVGPEFVNRLDNQTFLTKMEREDVPTDVIDALVTAATVTHSSGYEACQNCTSAWQAGIFWFDDCWAHETPHHN